MVTSFHRFIYKDIKCSLGIGVSSMRGSQKLPNQHLEACIQNNEGESRHPFSLDTAINQPKPCILMRILPLDREVLSMRYVHILCPGRLLFSPVPSLHSIILQLSELEHTVVRNKGPPWTLRELDVHALEDTQVPLRMALCLDQALRSLYVGRDLGRNMQGRSVVADLFTLISPW